MPEYILSKDLLAKAGISLVATPSFCATDPALPNIPVKPLWVNIFPITNCLIPPTPFCPISIRAAIIISSIGTLLEQV